MVESGVPGTGGWAGAPPEAAFQESGPRRRVALASVIAALFMVLLDISIVNVAIPAIRANLAANNADIQFVVAGYALAYAVVLITGGRLGDIFGRKRLFLIGMTGFIAASALCGLAQSAIMLDLSRVLQGVMAALMYPQVLSVLQVSFPPQQRGRVFGLVGAVIGIATIMGPLIGGLIIRNDITGGSWRWIFLVNVPIGIVALIGAVSTVTESRAPDATRLDMAGCAIVTVGLGLLVYPLVEGQVAGWPLWTYVCMGLSPLVLAAFVLYERSLPAARFPLVQLSLFRIRSFSVGVILSLVFMAGLPAFFFMFMLVLQVGLGFSALHAGLTTIPWSIGSAFASMMASRFLAPKLGRWTIVLGSSVLVLGIIGVLLTLHLRGTEVTSIDLIPSFLVSGLGLGAVIAPLITIILAGVPGRDAGSASGVLTTFQQLGGSIGVAVVGVVFFAQLSGQAPASAAAVTPQLQAQLAAAHLPQTQIDAVVGRFTHCFDAAASSSDPTVVPPGCPSNTQAPVNATSEAFSSAAHRALGVDYLTSVEETLWFNVGLWLLTAILALLLPRRQGTGPEQAASGTTIATPGRREPATVKGDSR